MKRISKLLFALKLNIVNMKSSCEMLPLLLSLEPVRLHRREIGSKTDQFMLDYVQAKLTLKVTLCYHNFLKTNLILLHFNQTTKEQCGQELVPGWMKMLLLFLCCEVSFFVDKELVLLS